MRDALQVLYSGSCLILLCLLPQSLRHAFALELVSDQRQRLPGEAAASEPALQAKAPRRLAECAQQVPGRAADSQLSWHAGMRVARSQLSRAGLSS